MDELYASQNPFVKHIHNQRLELIKTIAGANRGRLLDCGCGEGHLLERLSGIKYGVDCSKVALNRARERNPGADIREANITNLPFEGDFFDITICSEVLEHISDYKKAASEILRVTKNGGRIIISVPNERNWTIGRLMMLRFPIKLEDHINSFKYRDVIDLFGSKPKKVFYIPLNRTYQLALTQIFEFEKPKVDR